MSDSTYRQQLRSAGGTDGTYHQQLAQLAGIAQNVDEMSDIIEDIGENVMATSTVSTINVGVDTPICEITLTPGVWLILGFVKMGGGSAFQASAGINTGGASANTKPGYTQFPVTSQSTTVAVTIPRVVTVNQDTVYKLFVWSSGSTGSTRTVEGVLDAYKLK